MTKKKDILDDLPEDIPAENQPEEKPKQPKAKAKAKPSGVSITLTANLGLNDTRFCFTPSAKHKKGTTHLVSRAAADSLISAGRATEN